MSKLCATELRTGPNGSNYQYTRGDGDITDININAVRELARRLAERSGQRIGSLDSEGERAYRQLSDIIKRYQTAGRPYHEIYDVIIAEFSTVAVINPGTVGEVFMGCARSSGCGSNECNPACINSILRRPEDINKPCAVNVFRLDEKGQLTNIGTRVPNSSTAYIYLDSKAAMTNKICEELKRAGISQVAVYRVDNGACMAMFEGQVIPIGEVTSRHGGRKGGCKWGNCGGNNINNGVNDVTNEATGGMSAWWWLVIAIIAIIIFVVIIALIVAWVVRSSAKKAAASPDTCSGFQQKCANVYNRIC